MYMLVESQVILAVTVQTPTKGLGARRALEY